MYLLGTHKVPFSAIRRLAIECHALSYSAMALLRRSDYPDLDGKTKEAYEELISEKLLQLAIGIRTKFYQGADHRITAGFLDDVGTYVKYCSFAESEPLPFTLKDICDKIIHASSVHFVLDADVDVSFIELWGDQGTSRQPQNWVLTLMLPSVCEGILGWVDAIAEA
jgi:hypothetical protein